jgi:hypothetical protein
MAQHLAPEEVMYGIDSVHNGILLDSTLHAFWDSWVMSIDPVSPLSPIIYRGRVTLVPVARIPPLHLPLVR